MGQQTDGNIHAHFKAEAVSSDHLECGHRNLSWGKNVRRACHVTGNRWYKERQKRQTSVFPNQTPKLSHLQKHLKKRKHCMSSCTKRKSNMNQAQYMQATKQTHQTHGHLDREEITSQSFGAQCGLSFLPRWKKKNQGRLLSHLHRQPKTFRSERKCAYLWTIELSGWFLQFRLWNGVGQRVINGSYGILIFSRFFQDEQVWKFGPIESNYFNICWYYTLIHFFPFKIISN